MTVLEELTNSISIEQKIPNLRVQVVLKLKRDGELKWICNDYVTEVGKFSDGEIYSIPPRLAPSLRTWADKEGLTFNFCNNAHGMRMVRLSF